MTDYLIEKWRLLRMYKARRMFEINYRILRNTAKIMGAKHAS
ncbi:hypothetical protein [Mixta calida]|nr:hypothetical protein [Mixta calida]